MKIFFRFAAVYLGLAAIFLYNVFISTIFVVVRAGFDSGWASHMTLAFGTSIFAGQILMVIVGEKVALRFRFFMSFIGQALVASTFPFLLEMHINEDIFNSHPSYVCYAMILVAICGVCCSVSLSSLFGVFSASHPRTVALVNTGNGISGLFVFVLSGGLFGFLNDTSNTKNTQDTTSLIFILFGVAVLINVLAVVVCVFFLRDPIVSATLRDMSRDSHQFVTDNQPYTDNGQQYTNTHQYTEIELETHTSTQIEINENTPTHTELNRYYGHSEKKENKLSLFGLNCSSLFDICSVALTIGITFTFFPSVTSLISPAEIHRLPGMTSQLFSILVVGLFQTFDSVGFPLAYFNIILTGMIRILVLVTRLFIGISFVVNLKWNPSWLDSDLLVLISISLFALFGGWTASSSFASAPSSLETSKLRQRAGFAATLAAGVGTMIGSLIATALTM
eukprot:GHVR01148679.1.p1 GENE.GHVR01148679.1~~GHVR01148679.1.p1  ORF type:complete len:450 (+),score=21.36 GHVR01148679.1:36-1385(+)